MSAVGQILFHPAEQLQHNGLLDPGMPTDGWGKRLPKQIEGIWPVANTGYVCNVILSENRRNNLLIQLANIVSNKNSPADMRETGMSRNCSHGAPSAEKQR